jgi:hypothetical protein
MSEFLIRGASRARANVSLERASTVFVDVAEEATRAEVSRGGFPLGEIAIIPERLGSFLDDLVVVQTKVVSQAIQPGTAVARGTAIDLVLANPSDIPVRVIPGVHAAFENLTMASLNEQFAGNPVVRDIVRRRTAPEDLTTTERDQLTSALQNANVPVDQDNTVDSAFRGIQAAMTFLG